MDRFSALRDFCRNQFALDLRSLACLRMGLGSLILLDVILRLEDLTAFYTDHGIVPRSLLSIGLAYPSQWSFHLMNGTATFQLLLFLATAVAAAMLACGYRTRLSTVVCWLMLVSLHTRNPIVLNAGDKYLELLTFWGIFLPLGECWSIDAAKVSRIRAATVSSLAAVALHVQILLVYLCTGLLKQGVEAWQSGDAIQLALSKDYLVTSLGQQMLAYSTLLGWLTHATVYLEILGPIALTLSRGRTRAVVVAVFVAFHVGLALCFSIGLFPYVCIVAFGAFLPPTFWQVISKRPVEPLANRSYVAQSTPLASMFRSGVIVLALIVAIWSNLATLQISWKMPETIRSTALAFRWPQSWRLFVDLKEVDDGWFVFHAQFADGSSTDLLTGTSPVKYDKPPLASATFPNFRWRKLCTNIRLEKFKPVATYLGEYLLLERDRTHHDVHKLLGLQISYVKPANVAADNASSEIVVLGESFRTSAPLTQQVLFEWQNAARKYRDAIIHE
jgi:hypothetical protein